MWGRLLTCGRLSIGPGARPRKLFGRCSNSSIHWVHLDVPRDPPKLSFVTDHSVIALILPERPASEAQDPIALSGCYSLKRLHQLGNRHTRSDQEVHMVPHDDIGVEMVIRKRMLSIANGFDDHTRNLRLSKVQRPQCARYREDDP